MDILNRPVTHKRFGAGIIKSCENGTLQVYFQQYGARFFHYPDIFDTFLRADDAALEIQVQADLAAWRSTRDAQAAHTAAVIAETIQSARTVKKTAPRRKSPR